MNKPTITEKQKQIISSLYQFRFLHTHHIRQLLGHKNNNRTLAWLKDLIEKKYIKRHYDTSSLVDRSKPAVYYLAPRARQVLKENENITDSDLKYIYQEDRRNTKFIDHALFVADMFFYLRSNHSNDDEMHFFTKNQIRGYEHFPDPLPDAFIAIKADGAIRRYFLDIFDEYTPPFVIRNRVKMYISYTANSDWDIQTDSAPMPAVLIVCSRGMMQKHIYHYSKAVLEKDYDNKTAIFLTTKQKVTANELDVWEKVLVSEEA